MRNGDYLVGWVEQYVRQQQLLSSDELHLVALSGGADSVALLRILFRLGYRIEAVHCNFHLRGEESDSDELFVKDLCQKLNIKLHLIHFDTAEYASLHQVSIEMAARELRYRYFEQLRQDLEAETVCVAHHRDDAVETLLMNLLRGSGIHGLTGIRPHNGHIVRPLLGVSRHEIEEYLHSIGQDFVTDSTNLQPDVLRNKVRLQLLPLLEQLSPGAVDNIARSAYYLSEAEKVYNAQRGLSPLCEAREVQGDSPQSATLPFSTLKASPSPLCTLHEWLTPLGFNRIQIEQIADHFDAEPGRVFESSTHTLVIDREAIIVELTCLPMKPHIFPEPGVYRIDETAKIRIEEVGVEAGISRDPAVATLDASTIRFPLTLRTIEPGDIFQPYGMRGKKLVSDYLTDIKQNLLAKRRQRVLVDASGSILWLVGLRTDHRYRITPATTSILRIALQ
jgi:tRNA(Ile)-lysidine synthase